MNAWRDTLSTHRPDYPIPDIVVLRRLPAPASCRQTSHLVGFRDADATAILVVCQMHGLFPFEPTANLIDHKVKMRWDPAWPSHVLIKKEGQRV